MSVGWLMTAWTHRQQPGGGSTVGAFVTTRTELSESTCGAASERRE